MSVKLVNHTHVKISWNVVRKVQELELATFWSGFYPGTFWGKLPSKLRNFPAKKV